MENEQIIDQEQDQNHSENEQNFDNSENIKEGEEQLGINYEGEIDGEELPNQYEEEEHEEIKKEGESEEHVQKEGIEDELDQGIYGIERQKGKRREEVIEKIQDSAEKEEYEEPNEEVNIENEEKKDNTKYEKKKENNFGIKDKNNRDLNNNKNLSNKERIELLSNRLNLKINKAQNAKKNKNKNIIDKDIDDDNNKDNFYNFLNSNKKDDGLSDLLDKIQGFKQKNKNNVKTKLNSNSVLNDLDKELKKGLEKLNTINNKNENIHNLNEEQKTNYPNEGKILKNPKFKEIISMINKKQFKINNNFQKNELIGFMSNKTKNNNNFSNINLFVPKRNNYLSETFENKTNENNFSKFASNSKKYYVSCIDGKAIVNGVRKDIPFYYKLANNDNKINNNNTYIFGDPHKNYNTLNYCGKTTRRNNSFNINNFFKNEFDYEGCKTYKKLNINNEKNDNYSKGNMDSKTNRRNYFKRELKFLK